MSNKTTLSEFITKAKLVHANKFDYSLVKYVNNRTKVTLICPIHGEFTQTPTNHLSGNDCNKCGSSLAGTKQQSSTDIFITKANELHTNVYDYSKVKYKNSYTYVTIICKEHGEFKQTPNVHLDNHGCPSCNESKGEKQIRNYLILNRIVFIHQHRFSDCKNIRQLSFDFYLPDYNTCIEFNGEQHYDQIELFGGLKALNKQIKNDKIKLNYCENSNLKLIVVKYNESITDRLKELT